MDRLLLLFHEVSDSRLGSGNSFADRLNSRVTVSILGIFAFLVATGHYIGEPISCWCPAHFTSSNVDYANKVCWTNSTYFLHPDVDNIPHDWNGTRKIGYYQWVTMFLFFQAFLFYVPHLVWRSMNRRSGVPIHSFVDAAIERQKTIDVDRCDKSNGYLVDQLDHFVTDFSTRRRSGGRRLSVVHGNYTIVVFLVVKLLYVANIVGQQFLINAFLGQKHDGFHVYGFEVISKLMAGEEWTTSERFPRVTVCQFHMRYFGHNTLHTVQCTLPTNLLNEMLYIFIWFWFLVVLICTLASIVEWTAFLVRYASRASFVGDRLVSILARSDRSRDAGLSPDSLRSFVDDYLRRDGCFVLKLIAENTSDRIASELALGLWTTYSERSYATDIEELTAP